ncbi:MAG: energy-coupling factor transporter transmembrane component T [Thermodesulfovibrionales bacterium]|jgi:energy-coupling factor transport system permease protein
MTFILLYVGLAISLFLVRDITYPVTVAIIVCLLLFFVPFNKVKSGLIPILLFLLFTFAGNLFFHPGKFLFGSGPFVITDEGLALANIRTLRVFSMIYGAKILTFLLPLDEMILAMDKVLMPLEKIGVPVKEFFFIMGLTVKAFPVLTGHLAKAYRENWHGGESQGFRNRIRNMASFMVPIFINSIRCPESFFTSDDDRSGGRNR